MDKKISTHKDLEVWKIGIELVTDIYNETKKLPKEEIYGLSAQMRRSAVSVPAEGAARSSRKEYLRFLYISLGSLSELETQIIIAGNLGYINSTELLNRIETLRRKMLNFIKYIKSLTK